MGKTVASRNYLKLIIYSCLILLVTVIVVPLLWMILSSFKPGYEIFEAPLRFWPKNFTLSNYPKLFQEVPFARSFLNSVFVTGTFLIFTSFLSSLGGFAFAKYQFPFGNILFVIVLATLMIPVHIILVPLYLIMQKLGLVNSLWALIIPFSAHPLGIFLMRQYFTTIPSELMDAGRIDGCSEFGIFWRIALPLAKPAIAALVIVLGIEKWNSFLWPLTILNENETFTLPIQLATLLNVFKEKPEFGVVLAGGTLAVLPVVIMFLILQKHFVRGITMGAVKG